MRTHLNTARAFIKTAALAGTLTFITLVSPVQLDAQEPDSLTLEEILGIGRVTGSLGGSGRDDYVSVTSLRARRLTAEATFRNASAGFDLDEWIAARRRFLERVRIRFGLDEVTLPSRPVTTSPGATLTPESATTLPRAGEISVVEQDGSRPTAPEAREAVVFDRGPEAPPAGAPSLAYPVLLEMVEEAMAREELLLDLLLRIDARLERLEDVLGTLPDGLSSEELRGLIRDGAPLHQKR